MSDHIDISANENQNPEELSDVQSIDKTLGSLDERLNSLKSLLEQKDTLEEGLVELRNKIEKHDHKEMVDVFENRIEQHSTRINEVEESLLEIQLGMDDSLEVSENSQSKDSSRLGEVTKSLNLVRMELGCVKTALFEKLSEQASSVDEWQKTQVLTNDALSQKNNFISQQVEGLEAASQNNEGSQLQLIESLNQGVQEKIGSSNEKFQQKYDSLSGRLGELQQTVVGLKQEGRDHQSQLAESVTQKEIISFNEQFQQKHNSLSEQLGELQQTIVDLKQEGKDHQTQLIESATQNTEEKVNELSEKMAQKQLSVSEQLGELQQKFIQLQQEKEDLDVSQIQQGAELDQFKKEGEVFLGLQNEQNAEINSLSKKNQGLRIILAEQKVAIEELKEKTTHFESAMREHQSGSEQLLRNSHEKLERDLNTATSEFEVRLTQSEGGFHEVELKQGAQEVRFQKVFSDLTLNKNESEDQKKELKNFKHSINLLQNTVQHQQQTQKRLWVAAAVIAMLSVTTLFLSQESYSSSQQMLSEDMPVVLAEATSRAEPVLQTEDELLAPPLEAEVEIVSADTSSADTSSADTSSADTSSADPLDAFFEDSSSSLAHAAYEPTVEKVSGEEQVNMVEYVVKKNDSLWKIAKKHYGAGVKSKKIRKDNHLNSNRIKPGDVLRIYL